MIQPLILPRTRCLNDPVFTVLDSCLNRLSTAWPGHRTQLQRRSCTMHYTHVPVLSATAAHWLSATAALLSPATAAHSLSATAALRYPAYHHSLSPRSLCLFLLCILFQYSSSLSMIDHVPGFIHCFPHESNVKRTLFLCMISS